MHTPSRAPLAAFTIFLLLLLIPKDLRARSASAPEDSWPKVKCASLEQLDSEIRWCTDNERAVAYAKDCARRLADAWDASARDLKTLQNNGGSQRADLSTSGEKYQSTIDHMAFLTGQLMRGANQIARYPEVMADHPGRTSAADSAPCYQSAFQEIQKIVTDLDRRSREGVSALVATSDLQENVTARAEGIRSDSQVKLGNKLRKDSTDSSARQPSSIGQKNGLSDITGTQRRKGQYQ